MLSYDKGTAVNAVRLVDKLPLAYKAIDGLIANDFVGDKIFLQPEEDAMSDDDMKNNFISVMSVEGIELNPTDVQVMR